MVDRDDFELRLATTLAPMLLTLGALSLAGMGLMSGHRTMVDLPVAILAAGCIFAASGIIDSALDKLSLNWSDRLTLLGYGYALFCLVIGGMSFVIPLLYEAKRVQPENLRWQKHQWSFVLTGVCVIFKLMSRKNSSIWAWGIFILYCCSFFLAYYSVRI
jgi:hypothetical protein